MAAAVEAGGPVELATIDTFCDGAAVRRAGAITYPIIAAHDVKLVDVDEGFRMRGHGEPSLAIGDRVRCSFRAVADRLLPYFERDKE